MTYPHGKLKRGQESIDIEGQYSKNPRKNLHFTTCIFPRKPKQDHTLKIVIGTNLGYLDT